MVAVVVVVVGVAKAVAMIVNARQTCDSIGFTPQDHETMSCMKPSKNPTQRATPRPQPSKHRP